MKNALLKAGFKQNGNMFYREVEKKHQTYFNTNFFINVKKDKSKENIWYVGLGICIGGLLQFNGKPLECSDSEVIKECREFYKLIVRIGLGY
jgi:hypothetical protein